MVVGDVEPATEFDIGVVEVYGALRRRVPDREDEADFVIGSGLDLLFATVSQDE